MEIDSNTAYSLRLQQIQKQPYPIAVAIRSKCSNDAIKQSMLVSIDNRSLNFLDCVLDEIDLDLFAASKYNGKSNLKLITLIFIIFAIICLFVGHLINI